MMPPLQLVDGDTLLIDNSRMERFTNCPREGEYGILRKQIPADDNAALTFGGAIHLALKLRYWYGTGEVTWQIEARQMLLLEAHWKVRPTPVDNWRTLGLAQDVIHQYNQKYKIEPFELFKRPDGRYILEEGFAMPLGTVNYMGRKIKIMWIGKMDLPMKWVGEIFTCDHKTTSVGGDLALQAMQNSSQFKGYCWSMRERFKVKVRGAIVNLLICRKPAKTDKGKGNEFIRQPLYYDDDILNEWQINTLNIIEDFLHCHEREYFPMFTTQCARKYGRCDYFDVCTLAPIARLAYLNGPAFKQDVWSPLQEDALDIQKFISIPDSELKAYERPKFTKTAMPEISDIIAGLT